ncbi:MAG: metalloregulator ArsR/SmtB family transcription factor [Chloroflexota bacterium]
MLNLMVNDSNAQTSQINTDQTNIDTVFFALTSPIRREIINILSQGSTTVAVLAEHFTISPPAISKHLRVLERAGLLRQEKQGRVRECHLITNPLQEASAWLDQYEHFWHARFDALDALLAEQNKTQSTGYQQTQVEDNQYE